MDEKDIYNQAIDDCMDAIAEYMEKIGSNLMNSKDYGPDYAAQVQYLNNQNRNYVEGMARARVYIEYLKKK